MNSTEDKPMTSLVPEGELRADFARRRLRQILLIVPMVLAIIALRVTDDGATPFGIPPGVLLTGACVIILGTLAFSIWNWRCPSCDGYLGKTINPRFCQKCGFQLRA